MYYNGYVPFYRTVGAIAVFTIRELLGPDVILMDKESRTNMKKVISIFNGTLLCATTLGAKPDYDEASVRFFNKYSEQLIRLYHLHCKYIGEVTEEMLKEELKIIKQILDTAMNEEPEIKRISKALKTLLEKWNAVKRLPSTLNFKVEVYFNDDGKFESNIRCGKAGRSVLHYAFEALEVEDKIMSEYYRSRQIALEDGNGFYDMIEKSKSEELAKINSDVSLTTYSGNESGMESWYRHIEQEALNTNLAFMASGAGRDCYEEFRRKAYERDADKARSNEEMAKTLALTINLCYEFNNRTLSKSRCAELKEAMKKYLFMASYGLKVNGEKRPELDDYGNVILN